MGEKKQRGNGRWSTARDVAILLVVFVSVNRAFLLYGESYPIQSVSDLLQLTRPVLSYTGQALCDGELPLWNPYMGAGYPNHAMGCAGVFYPSAFIYGILDFPRALVWDMMIHHLLAALGAYVLGRRLTESRVAAVALALITLRSFVFLPSVVSMGHVWTERLLSWSPLTLLCLWRIIESRRAGWAAGLALALGMQLLTGDFQMFICQGCVFGVFALAMLLTQAVSGDPRAALRALALCTAAGATAIGIAAVQWLPSLHLIQESTRNQGVSLAYIRSFSAILGLPLFLSSRLIMKWMFAGVAVALLAMAGVISGREKHRWAFAAALLTAFLFSFWPDTFLASWIHRIPLLGQAREPSRILEPALFLINLLAVRQFSRWFCAGDAPCRGHLLWMALALVAAAPALMWLTGLPLVRVACVMAVMVAAFLVRAHLPHLRHASTGAMLLAALVMVGEYVQQESPNVVALSQPATYPAREDAYHPVHPLHYAINPDLTRFLEEIAPEDRVAIFSALYYKGAVSSGSMTGNRMFANYHALQLDRFVRWFDGITGAGFAERESTGELAKDNYDVLANPEALTSRWFPALDLLNIRYLVSLDDGFPSEIEQAVSTGRFREFASGRLRVHENTAALPTAVLVHQAAPAATMEDVVARLRDPGFDYRAIALVSPRFPIEQVTPSQTPGSVHVEHMGRNDWTIRVSTDAPGLLVLTEVDYDGWQATVDGQRAEIHRAYGIFKAVLVPAGQHTIRFIFTPHRDQAGLRISMASVAALMAIVILLMSAKKRERNGAVPGSTPAEGVWNS